MTTLLRRAVGRLLRGTPIPVARGPLRGVRIIVGAAAGSGGGLSVHLGRSEDMQLRKVVASLRPGEVFFDIGANVGVYSLAASKAVGSGGRVLAVEPVVRNVFLLRKHAELNKADNVVVLPGACGERPGCLLFQEGANHATGSLLAGPTGGGTPVMVTSIDALVSVSQLRPDAIKIDVEGAEYDVLTGAKETLRSLRPSIFLSIHSDTLRENCLSLLRGCGYDVQPLDSGDTHRATEYFACAEGMDRKA